jgi:hypothetical protein
LNRASSEGLSGAEIAFDIGHIAMFGGFLRVTFFGKFRYRLPVNGTYSDATSLPPNEELTNREDSMARDEHNQAAEHHENAAKAHRSAAEHHGKGDHAKGKEHANSAKQHSQTTDKHSDQAHSKSQQQK